MTNNQDSELQGAEREREALAHIRKEQELRTGAVFDQLLLTYLKDGDSPEFRDYLLKKTILYLESVTANPHVIKAAVPDWVTRLLVVPMPQSSIIVGADPAEVESVSIVSKWIATPKPDDPKRFNVVKVEPDDSTDESEDGE